MFLAEAGGLISQSLLSNHQQETGRKQIISPQFQVLVFVPKVGSFSVRNCGSMETFILFLEQEK